MPVKGNNDKCFRIEIRGCTKEPWLDVLRKLKQEVKVKNIALWNVYKRKIEKSTLGKLCFPDFMYYYYFEHLSTKVFFVLNNQDLRILPQGKHVLFPKKIKHEQIMKCVAEDENGNSISTQMYIFDPGHPKLCAIIPIQELGFNTNGGLPLLTNPGTIWNYTPLVGKITMLVFRPGSYRKVIFGYFDYEESIGYFHLTLVKTKGKSVDSCYEAVRKLNLEYFTVKDGRCFVSWFLPYAAGTGNKSLYKKRLTIYRIMRHVSSPYIASWRKNGKKIGKDFKIEHTANKERQIDKCLHASIGKYHFLFDSYMTTRDYDSHTLLIRDFNLKDAAVYSLIIRGKLWKNDRQVNLRHYGEPRIKFPDETGACEGSTLVISAEPIRTEYQTASEWGVEWRKIVDGKPVRTKMETRDVFVIKAKRSSKSHAGLYRIRIKNHHGTLQAFTTVNIISNLPEIRSVTRSPHVAVEDISDTLEVVITNESHLTAIEWRFNNKVIEDNEYHYTFPGSTPGYPETRKILRFSKITRAMSGKYTVTAKTKFCSFSKTILVEAYEKPRIRVKPSTPTINFPAGRKRNLNINVLVRGGHPQPELKNMFWYKDEQLLQNTRSSRLTMNYKQVIDKDEDSADKGKRVAWNSTLTINKPSVRDSGLYSFQVIFPNAKFVAERKVEVTDFD